MRLSLLCTCVIALLLSACQPVLQTSETTTDEQAETLPDEQQETTSECPTVEASQESEPDDSIPQEMTCPVCPVCKASTARKQSSSENAPVIIGALEKVHVEPPGILLTARIDTGAKSSSIHAENIVRFEREGERWASFDIFDDDNNLIHLEMPIERRVRITQANDEIQKRYVVKMWLKLGKIREKVDVTLADRGDLTHPLLIGRNFLIDTAVVDVSKKFTQ